MSDTPHTVLVTGAADGIGHVTAHRLAAYGATVIPHALHRAGGR